MAVEEELALANRLKWVSETVFSLERQKYLTTRRFTVRIYDLAQAPNWKICLRLMAACFETSRDRQSRTTNPQTILWQHSSISNHL